MTSYSATSGKPGRIQIIGPASFDEDSGGDFERESNLLGHGDGRVASAALDVTDVGAVDVSRVRECFSAESSLVAQGT